MVLIHSSSESTTILLFEYLFITLPCLIWMPSYFLAIVFFVKMNYLITGMNNTLIQPLLKGVFWCSVVVFVWFSFRAIIRSDYITFVYDACWLIGTLYVLMGSAVFLFGQRLLWSVSFNAFDVYKIIR